jgi:formylglycine-generating enzyme required for sulfatase activity
MLQECLACPPLAGLAAGSFAVGTGPGQQIAIDQPFAIGKYEVTVTQWLACVEAGGCEYLPETAGAPPDSPVRDVSWDDAQEYVAWLSRLTGQRYRLPSEAEWEYAARGGTTSRFWWSEALETGYANCADCGGAWARAAPAEVGSYAPNPFGLHETSGGVMEWTADCWRDAPEAVAYSAATATGDDCAARVLRGGSWRHHHGDVSSASRFGAHAERRAPEHGLRVARDLN